jgi:hypothetical protein
VPFVVPTSAMASIVNIGQALRLMQGFEETAHFTMCSVYSACLPATVLLLLHCLQYTRPMHYSAQPGFLIVHSHCIMHSHDEKPGVAVSLLLPHLPPQALP